MILLIWIREKMDSYIDLREASEYSEFDFSREVDAIIA